MPNPRGPNRSYSQENLEAALAAIRANTMSVRQASATWSVPRSTLMDMRDGKYPVKKIPHTVLTEEEEGKLIDWLVACAKAGEGKDKEQLCLAVQSILNAEGRKTTFKNNKPGYYWYQSFMERHKGKVRERKTMVLGQQRAQVTEEKIRGWFQKAQEILMEDGIDITNVPPSNVFNCDETGFPFYLGGSVVISDLTSKHPYQVGSDTKHQVTVLGCCSADGNILKPTILFPGVRWTWRPWEDFDVDYALTSNGWINNSIFMKWLQYTFLPAVDHLERPVVLFIDGHTSHLTQEVYEFSVKHKLTVYTLPSHSSHIIQPLDLVFYGSLKDEWKRAVRDYKTISRHASVTKQTFAVVFADVWSTVYSKEKIIHAFESSGLCPWRPDRPDYSKCSASLVWGKTQQTCNSSAVIEVTEDSTSEEAPSVPSQLLPDGVPISSPQASTSEETPSVPIPTPQASTPEEPPSVPIPTPQASTSEKPPSVPIPTPQASTSEEPPSVPSQVLSDDVHISSPQASTLEEPPSVHISSPQTSTSEEPPSVPIPSPQASTSEEQPSVPIPSLQALTSEEPPSVSIPSPETSTSEEPPSVPSQVRPDDVLISSPQASTSEEPLLVPILSPQTSTLPQTPRATNKAAPDRDEANLSFYTCQLIDHILACGWTAADMFHIRRRQFQNIMANDNEPEYKKYLELWNKVVPPPTFDNLPTPTSFGRKSTRAPRAQPPSYVSHISFKEFHEAKEKEDNAKKMAKEERKTAMLKKKEEREKKKLEDKEKKRVEREKKKAEMLEKRKMAKKGKGKGKKRKLVERSESSSEGEKVQVVYDDQSDMDILELCGMADVDDNVCAVCGSDRDLNGWIGCECGRWYHRGCTGEKKDIVLAMNEDEINVFEFKCSECVHKNQN